MIQNICPRTVAQVYPGLAVLHRQRVGSLVWPDRDCPLRSAFEANREALVCCILCLSVSSNKPFVLSTLICFYVLAS